MDDVTFYAEDAKGQTIKKNDYDYRSLNVGSSIKGCFRFCNPVSGEPKNFDLTVVQIRDDVYWLPIYNNDGEQIGEMTFPKNSPKDALDFIKSQKRKIRMFPMMMRHRAVSATDEYKNHRAEHAIDNMF
jgi:hypothetical protein